MERFFYFTKKCVKMFINSWDACLNELKLSKQSKCGWHMCCFHNTLTAFRINGLGLKDVLRYTLN